MNAIIMKNFDLNSMGVHEMNVQEMQDTDGGILCAILIIAGVFLLTGCTINNNTVIGNNNSIGQGASTTTRVDSTANGNTIDH